MSVPPPPRPPPRFCPANPRVGLGGVNRAFRPPVAATVAGRDRPPTAPTSAGFAAPHYAGRINYGGDVHGVDPIGSSQEESWNSDHFHSQSEHNYWIDNNDYLTPPQEGNGYFSDLMNDQEYENILVDSQRSIAMENTNPKRPNQKRSKNFSEDEDKLLVSAWLNTSLDAVRGNDQSAGTFWERIYEYYHRNKTFVSERTQGSLTHRFSNIQENVNRFTGYVSQIEGRRPSGLTE